MRDPTTWAIPLVRLGGVRLRLHALFILAPLLFLRFAIEDRSGLTGGELFAFICLLPLPVVLIHELGHFVAARMLGGEPRELVLAPLGGLVPPDVSGTKANMAVALAGPLASLLLCVVLTSIAVGSGFAPAMQPFADPFACPSIHAPTGRTFTTEARPSYYRPGTAERVGNPKLTDEGTHVDPEQPGAVLDRAVLPAGMAWLWRANWLSLWLAIANLCLWAVPLDAGRAIAAIVASRIDDPLRAALITARFSILLVTPMLFVLAIVWNEALLLLLVAVILGANARMVTLTAAAQAAEQEEKPFGYDFSNGYTSLEGEEPRERPAKLGFFESRRKAREAERLRKEAEQDQRDAERIDQLLEKIQQSGTASLTAEEKAFLDKASLRYRERS
jgi:stage IV sporulation protein FB